MFGRSVRLERNFLASALALFLEMALIRWISSELRIFAYGSNLVLVACVLGFGVGCLRHARPQAWLAAGTALLTIALILQVPWENFTNFGPQGVTAVLQNLTDLAVFRGLEQAPTSDLAIGLSFAVGWTAALFFLLAQVMIPFGQVVGSSFASCSAPLSVYSVNVAGSLAGILGFTAVSAAELPPLLWFPPAILLSALLAGERARRALPAIAALLALALWPRGGVDQEDFWTPYHKLTIISGQEILVNNTGYQGMYPISIATLESGPMNRWVMPYATERPAGRVLIVGAGSGNDAAVALQAGANSVTAVEIDPAIYRIGKRHHPQQPYSDPRVHVVLDDARHFLKTTGERYDQIVFSHLDAHTVLSGLTLVRLDNYIHTLEGFLDARAHLAPGGIMYVGYWCPEPFIAERIHRNLSLAFGYPPVAMQRLYEFAGRQVVEAHFLIGDPGVMPPLQKLSGRWSEYPAIALDSSRTAPSTDDWPYLALKERTVPPLMLLISSAILLVSGFAAVRARAESGRFDGRLFFMGAAFMLLEVHNVSRLALVFGSTWQVNAWVIAAMMGVVLIANGLQTHCEALGLRWLSSPAVLFASLALCAWLPAHLFITRDAVLGQTAAALVLALPVLFAALLFARSFSGSPSPGSALGWNVVGAVVGGLSGNLSYVLGVSALIYVVAIFYALALLWGPLDNPTASREPDPARQP